jgi:CBS domain-containing protein
MAKSVRDAMSHDLYWCSPDDSVEDAARAMRDHDVGSLPIREEGDRLFGIITDRDITIRVVAEGKDPTETKVRDAASSSVVTVDPDQDLDEAIRLMAQNQVRRLPVVEEDGRLAGMLAQADIATEADEARAGEMVEEISR